MMGMNKKSGGEKSSSFSAWKKELALHATAQRTVPSIILLRVFAEALSIC
jgi:hypothetical protein